MITMDELIAESFQRLDNEDSRDELIFRNWIYRAMRWIGPHAYSIKTKCIEVCDLSIKKPCDYWYGLDLNLIGTNGEIYYYQYAEHGFMNSEQSDSGVEEHLENGGSLSGYRTIEIGEDHYCFNLNSIAGSSSIKTAELKYYAMPKDEHGDLMISEDVVEAIHAYLRWMYIERGRERSRGTRMYPLSEVNEARTRWQNYKAMVQGNIKMPSPQAAEVMLRKWVTLIPDFKNKRRNSKNSRFNTRY